MTSTTNKSYTARVEAPQTISARPLLSGVGSLVAGADLARLSDEDLLLQATLSRDAGEVSIFGEAVSHLVYRHLPQVERRVARKVPSPRVEEVVDAVFDSTIPHLLAGGEGFRGRTMGEFKSWLNTITNRRIADFHRSRREEEDVRLSRLEEQGVEIAEERLMEKELDSIVARKAITSVLRQLPDQHREVAVSTEIRGHSAAEVAAAEEGMNEANVYKIRERFRKKVRIAYCDTTEFSEIA